MRKIGFILCVLIFVSGPALPAAAAVDYPLNLRLNHYDHELAQLEWEIKTLNLINGLYLTHDQLESLLHILQDLERLNERYALDLENAVADVKTSYTILRDDLLDDDIVDSQIERRAGAAKNKLEDLVIEYASQQKQLEQNLLAVFTDKQIAIADEFLPCIIPPKNDNNTRIGQAAASNPRMEQMLEKMRAMPFPQFQEMLPGFIARHLDNYEIRHGILSLEQRDAESDRLYDLALQVWEMDDMEFQLQKEDIASQIMPSQARAKPGEQTKTHAQGARKKYQLSVVGSFLLNENLIPVIEHMLEN